MGYLRAVFISLSLIVFVISCDVTDVDGDEDNQEEEDQEEVEENPPEYSTEEEVEEYISGMYSDLSHNDYYGFNFIVISSLSSDIVELTATDGENIEALREFDKYEIDPESPILESFWNKSYELIQKGDTLVTYLPDSDLNQEFIEESIGEAQFLKALAYFDLVRSFGGVPANSLDEETPVRLTREESFEMIINLLHQAVDHLPTFAESSSANKEAATALLARCYIFLGQWNEAADIASDIVENGSFSLSEEYQSVFDNRDNAEVIFSLELGNNKLADWYTPEEEGGMGNLAIHQEFGNTMTERVDDTRNQLVHSDDGKYRSLKLNTDSPVYLPILRLSEVQLLFAEALVQLGDIPPAMEQVNQLRERANLEPITAEEQSAITEAIRFERAVEFFGEGHRWFDLVRTDRAIDVLQDLTFYDDDMVTLSEEHRKLFPIPQAVMEENPNLEQNPGY
jgi:tetratricopeptide (TPR) repeat protein